MALGYITLFFLIWGIGSRRWGIVILVWMYLVSGTVLLVLLIPKNPILGVIVFMFWVIYPMARLFRKQ